MIDVLIADDHPVVRDGLSGMVAGAPDLRVVGTAVDGIDAVAKVDELRPQVRVVVLTTYGSDADIVRAVEAGASGYLLKDAQRDTLLDAIPPAARGETVLAPPVAARLMSKLRAPTAEELTPRELDVLREVARGRTNAEIGRVLHIGEATVKTHLSRAFAKLQVDDRAHAVTMAYERGLLAPNR